MKATISGKRYESDRCEVLGRKTYYNNGNPAAYVDLVRASDGTYLIDYDSRDCFYGDSSLYLWDEVEYPIDVFDLTDEQEARCVDLGLIKVIS